MTAPPAPAIPDEVIEFHFLTRIYPLKCGSDYDTPNTVLNQIIQDLSQTYQLSAYDVSSSVHNWLRSACNLRHAYPILWPDVHAMLQQRVKGTVP